MPGTRRAGCAAHSAWGHGSEYAVASTMRVVRCRVRSSRSGQRAALPRRSRQVASRGSNQRPSGRPRSSIPCGRRHRSHSPPARSKRTRRLSSGQSWVQGPQFGANRHCCFTANARRCRLVRSSGSSLRRPYIVNRPFNRGCLSTPISWPSTGHSAPGCCFFGFAPGAPQSHGENLLLLRSGPTATHPPGIPAPLRLECGQLA